ncbi:MAG TPA: PKD domain-containing protein [Gemmatimonadota bacterium]|jgi:PKD repeat protein
MTLVRAAAAAAFALLVSAFVAPDAAAAALQNPPNARDDRASTRQNRGVAIPVLFNDSGSGLRVTALDDPPNGSASIGLLDFVTYDPDPGFRGTDVFSYTVTDADGETDSALVTVTVGQEGGNEPPDGEIDEPDGDVTIDAGGAVIFEGEADDDEDDEDDLTWSWSFPGGAPETSDEEDPGPVVFSTPGTFVVQLVVTDRDGASDPAPPTRQVTVLGPPANLPPEGTIVSPSGDVTIHAGESVTFEAAANDPDGTVASVSWDFGGGAPASSELVPGAVTFAQAGTFTVTFVATDDDGAPDPAPPTRVVTVLPAGGNQRPQATILTPSTDRTLLAGEGVDFTGTAADPDGTITAWRWDFGGGAPASTQQNPGLVRFFTPGVYEVTFTAFDDDGESDPVADRRLIIVVPPPPVNQPPSATITQPPGPVTIAVGESVTFSGSASDPDGSVVAWLWNFAGGAPNRGVEDPGPVTFTIPGTFRVSFNVTDNDGASDPSPPSVVVTVQGPPGGGQARLNVETEQPGSADRVDGHDVMFVLRATRTQDLRADVNLDGRVDETDVQLVLAGLGDVE